MTTPLSTLREKIPDQSFFLKNIAPEDPVGPSLRYGSLYDEVRLSRQEDDPRLSMGIWKTELKRADWGKIESLCVEALLTESKDLQIAAWLTEAWTSLDGIEGYMRGIQLLSGLCETFWETIHPLPQDGDDMENRLMIFEWLDTTLSSRLLLVNLTQSKYDQTSFGLGFFKSAQHSDASQKRTEKNNAPARKIDPSKVIGTVEEFQKSLDQTPDAFLVKQRQNFGEASQATQAFKTMLASLLGAASPSFFQILGSLKEMERIMNTALQSRMPPEPIVEAIETPLPDASLESTVPKSSSSSVAPAPLEKPSSGTLNLKTREDAYHQLGLITTFLEQNDPHSLAPQLLRQLIRWKNKNMVDIFGEIAQSPQELDVLMRLLRKDVT